MKFSSAIVILSVLLLSCGGNSSRDNSGAAKTNASQNNVADSNVVKVYVELNGAITANGNPVSLVELDSSLSKLKANNGVVYYSRDNATQDAPEVAMKVMELVVKYSLPIKLFTDKTFSEIVKPN